MNTKNSDFHSLSKKGREERLEEQRVNRINAKLKLYQ